MQKAIIGKKVGMTQIFDESGKVIPVTVIEAGPCVVTQKKTLEQDGYVSVQLGFENVKESKLTKPEAGHLKKAGVEAKKHLKEFKLDASAEMNVGDVIKADTFAAGDKVDVVGTSKGHGYQGVVKRWNAGRTPHDPRRRPCATVTPVLWAPLPTPPGSSRVRSALVRWVWSRSPSRIWMW